LFKPFKQFKKFKPPDWFCWDRWILWFASELRRLFSKTSGCLSAACDAPFTPRRRYSRAVSCASACAARFYSSRLRPPVFSCFSAFLRGLHLEGGNAPDHSGAVAVRTSDRFNFFLVLSEGKHEIEVQIALLAVKLVRRHSCSKISLRSLTLCLPLIYTGGVPTCAEGRGVINPRF